MSYIERLEQENERLREVVQALTFVYEVVDRSELWLAIDGLRATREHAGKVLRGEELPTHTAIEIHDSVISVG